MSVFENAPLMPFYTLRKGQQVRFTAIDAATGATVPQVVISEMVIGKDQDDTPDESPARVTNPTGAYLPA